MRKISGWTATHEIVFRPRIGRPRKYLVMLSEDRPGQGGPAYEREEWEAGDQAQWERSPGKRWTCQGQSTPGGESGTVEVRSFDRVAFARCVRESFPGPRNRELRARLLACSTSKQVRGVGAKTALYAAGQEAIEACAEALLPR